MVLEWWEEKRKISRAWDCLTREDEVGLGECVTWDGVSPNHTNEDGLSLLHRACEMGNAGLVHCLAEVNGVNLDQQTPGNLWTPLHYAVFSKSVDCSAILLTRGANPNLTNQAGQTSLHLALLSENEELSALLIRNGGDPNLILGRRTPLYFAVRNNMELIVALLLADPRTQPQIPDGHGWTPLHWAARNGNTKTVGLLLEFATSQACCNAVSMRSSSSGKRSIERNKEYLVDVNAVSCNGFAPLHQAVRSGNLEVVEMLCQAGAKVEMEGNRGVTPLSIAVREGKKEIVQELLKRGADPNQSTGGQEMCPLHWAEDPDIAQCLLSFGASVSLKNGLGQTPLDRARELGKAEVGKLLAKVTTEEGGEQKCKKSGISFQKVPGPFSPESKSKGTPSRYDPDPPCSPSRSPSCFSTPPRFSSFISGPTSPLSSSSPSTPPNSPFSLISRSPPHPPSLVYRTINFSRSDSDRERESLSSLRSLTDLSILSVDDEIPSSPFDRVCFFLSLTWHNFTNNFTNKFEQLMSGQDEDDQSANFFSVTLDELLVHLPSRPSPPRSTPLFPSPLSPHRDHCNRRSLTPSSVNEENTSITFFPPCD
eukprot:CAMPEP_0201513896 /NCGR_PEP_ID=MMETSP0161_2-20130828/5863_1 /ASSEMBLY_ACC=CAM_ASM_000251 /TAXON_ID=180227 /ORGANISM="Neoparamoeba aestuarina, Strain SoJaBio B1-5/56/2" /LENGTH=594 /DNA_ID=CAMNT_0047910285 /DNA_START=146 /DNA_END=1930 /DNA_ORIENTATION=+